jgi:hypothetical protein
MSSFRPLLGGATALAALSLACGPEAPKPPPEVAPQPTTAKLEPDDPPVPPVRFENPGGMWMPSQLASHAETLTELGLEVDPAALSDPMAHPLGAVVWLGGCSGSFVSPAGLIITNHHCAIGALQYNSNEKENLLRDGFLAKTRGEERSNGPAARVYVTQAFRDVSAEVRDGIEKVADDHARHELIESREKTLVAACEKDRPDVRCSLVSYFGGESFILIEQLELRDIRLVYAPEEGVGSFGGEIDNWRWPRHSGDYAFFRAYVGPDGKPADHAAENVPYQPKHHLKVADRPLQAGDLVMVAGYPGSTSRLKTAEEVAEAVGWYYPRRLKLTEEYIAVLERLGAEDPELARKGERLLRGLANVQTNTKGMLDGLVKGGLQKARQAMEAELRAWSASSTDHAGAGEALDRMGAHHAKYRGRREQDAALSEALFMSSLIGAADTIVHMAAERPKKDGDRDPRFQARNHKRLEQAQIQAQNTYDRRLDSALLELALVRAARLPKDQRPKLLDFVVGASDPTAANIKQALAAMYGQPELESADKRVELLKTATLADLAQSKDPLIALAMKLRAEVDDMERRSDAYSGATVIDRPRYVAALRAKNDGVLAPDANSTLRVTYGTVRGYRPSPEAKLYYPFTRLSGMVKKHTGEDPFDAPAAVVEAASKGPFGPYVHEPFGEVPVDFLADLDITGGNSGSATLNARGELVGLVFDGNYEAMASDWIFMPAITRSIHVDIRYVLWLMDRVHGADHLLKEMGIEPRL